MTWTPAVDCEGCGVKVPLVWDSWDYKTTTLRLCGCESAGVYAVYVDCAQCGHRQEVAAHWPEASEPKGGKTYY